MASRAKHGHHTHHTKPYRSLKKKKHRHHVKQEEGGEETSQLKSWRNWIVGAVVAMIIVFAILLCVDLVGNVPIFSSAGNEGSVVTTVTTVTSVTTYASSSSSSLAPALPSSSSTGGSGGALSSSSSSSSPLAVGCTYQPTDGSTVFCVADYGASSLNTDVQNTNAIQAAVAAALAQPFSTLLFESGVVYQVLMPELISGTLVQDQIFVVDGAGSMLLITSDGQSKPYGNLIDVATPGMSPTMLFNNTLRVQNLTVNMMHPPWAQGYITSQPSATTTQLVASGLVPDPVLRSSSVTSVAALSMSLSTFIWIGSVGPCGNATLVVNNNTNPSSYTLTTKVLCALPPLPVGSPVVVLTNWASATNTHISCFGISNFQISNVRFQAAGNGVLSFFCGNVVADRWINSPAPGYWLTASTVISKMTKIYTAASFTNSVFSWSLDDDTDDNYLVNAIYSPVSKTTSPVISSTSTSLLVYGNMAGIAPTTGHNTFYMRTALGSYVLDENSQPYAYNLTVINPSNPSTGNRGWQWGQAANAGLQFYNLSLSSTAAGISALPVSSALNNYILEPTSLGTLYVSNCTFGPGRSSGVNADTTLSTLIENNRFVDVLKPAVKVAGIQFGEGPQVINLVVRNNHFTRSWNTYIGDNNITQAAIDLFTLLPTWPTTASLLLQAGPTNPPIAATAGGNINVTITGNTFAYAGSSYPPINIASGNAIQLGGTLNGVVSNNIIIMNGSMYGYGIAVFNSTNILLCNNTVLQASRSGATFVSADSSAVTTAAFC